MARHCLAAPFRASFCVNINIFHALKAHTELTSLQESLPCERTLLDSYQRGQGHLGLGRRRAIVGSKLK